MEDCCPHQRSLECVAYAQAVHVKYGSFVLTLLLILGANVGPT
jgi:hypothetical protein